MKLWEQEKSAGIESTLSPLVAMATERTGQSDLVAQVELSKFVALALEKAKEEEDYRTGVKVLNICLCTFPKLLQECGHMTKD